MLNLFKVRMSPTAGESVAKILNSGYIGQGPKVEEFEDLLKESLNTKTRPVTTNSCTSALDLSLLLCNVQPGDEVISTPATCFATNSVILNRKAKIKWADVDPKTFNIDPKSVEQQITSKTKAIIAVNWGGRLCDYKTLKSFGVPVIEDAAHTWDTFFDKTNLPERGDYICYSFQAIKFLTTADGGLLVCPDEKTEEKARLLRWFGLDRTKGASFRCAQNIQVAGLKYHLNDVSAAIGIDNLPLANLSVQKHRFNARFLIDNIKNPNIYLPPWDNSCSYWILSICIEKGSIPAFIDYLKDNNIEGSPVHYRNDKYDVTKEFEIYRLPGIEAFATKQVCIPVGWWLTDEDLQHIAKVCNEWTGWR